MGKAWKVHHTHTRTHIPLRVKRVRKIRANQCSSKAKDSRREYIYF